MEKMEIPKLDLYKKIDESHKEVYSKVHGKILESEEFKTLEANDPDAAIFFKKEKYKEVPPIDLNNKHGYYYENTQICIELTPEEFKAWWSGYNRSLSLIMKQLAEIDRTLKTAEFDGGMKR